MLQLFRSACGLLIAATLARGGWLDLTPQGLALQEAPSLLGALTAGGSCGGWEGGLALETGKTQSQTNAQKTRRVPTVSCTLC